MSTYCIAGRAAFPSRSTKAALSACAGNEANNSRSRRDVAGHGEGASLVSQTLLLPREFSKSLSAFG